MQEMNFNVTVRQVLWCGFKLQIATNLEETTTCEVMV